MINYLNRNKHVAIGVALLGIVTVSCKKSVLDVVPFTSFSDATAFTTPSRIDAAMNGVYDAAQSGFYAGGQVRGYPFGAAALSQSEMRGEDMNNDQLFYQGTYEATYNNVSPNQQFMFETLYSLANKANLMIEGVGDAVSKNVITQTVGNQYIAEARFLRAMAHHELVINFARPFSDGAGSKLGVVYREVAVNTPDEIAAEKAKTRATVAQNYAKILADLDYAESNLATGTAGTASTFRASKAAAIALKMRVKQHMQDWAGVIAEGNKLVPATAPYTSPIGGWRLTANPGDPFVLPGTSVENIFSIRNAATDNPGVNGAIGNMLTSPATGGRGLVKVSPIIYNHPTWLCDDKRRTSLLVGYNLSATTGAYFTTKYKDPATASDPTPIIRYAEVLLTLAEAEARSSATVSPRALELLNAVRNRALASPATQGYTIASFATPAALVQAILDERRIEFLAEGRRWADIHRLSGEGVYGFSGIPAKIGSGAVRTAQYVCGAGSTPYTTAIASFPYSDYRFIWPVPLSETQQNPTYQQNPGY